MAFHLLNSKFPEESQVKLHEILRIMNQNNLSPINFNLYAYAGNNPVKYVDPDGRKIRHLTLDEWTVVKDTIARVTTNLDLIITQLEQCNNNVDALPPEIREAAETWISSDFSTYKANPSILASRLRLLSKGLKALNMNNVFYEYDYKGSYYAIARPDVLKNIISVTENFFSEPDSGGLINKEGTLIHEVSHNFFILNTNDITYDYDKCPKLPDSGKNSKQNNARNWQWFYANALRGVKIVE